MSTQVTIDVHEHNISDDRTAYAGVIYDARTGTRIAACVRRYDRDAAYDEAKAAAEDNGWAVVEY